MIGRNQVTYTNESLHGCDVTENVYQAWIIVLCLLKSLLKTHKCLWYTRLLTDILNGWLLREIYGGFRLFNELIIFQMVYAQETQVKIRLGGLIPKLHQRDGH